MPISSQAKGEVAQTRTIRIAIAEGEAISAVCCKRDADGAAVLLLHFHFGLGV